MEKEIKKDKTLAVALIVISALVAVFLIVAVALPVIRAKLLLNEKLDGYRELSDDDMMTIFDPVYRDGSFYGDVTAEISADESKEIAEMLLDVCDGAKYSSMTITYAGNWDASIVLRKNGGGICTVYFAEDEIYVAKDEKQYRFKPSKAKAESFRELVELIDKKISENA